MKTQIAQTSYDNCFVSFDEDNEDRNNFVEIVCKHFQGEFTKYRLHKQINNGDKHKFLRVQYLCEFKTSADADNFTKIMEIFFRG